MPSTRQKEQASSTGHAWLCSRCVRWLPPPAAPLPALAETGIALCGRPAKARLLPPFGSQAGGQSRQYLVLAGDRMQDLAAAPAWRCKSVPADTPKTASIRSQTPSEAGREQNAQQASSTSCPCRGFYAGFCLLELLVLSGLFCRPVTKRTTTVQRRSLWRYKRY